MQILNFLIRLSYSDLNNERLSEIHTYTNCMKKYLLICCLAISCIATGQKKNYISLSFISAFPVGDFAKTETNYISSTLGYAKRGIGADLLYVHRNNKGNFGFAATLRWRQNKIDTASVLVDQENTQIPPFAWTKKEINWSLKAIMTGGYFGRSISPKLAFNSRILTGIALATLPEIHWTGTAKSPYSGYSEFKREKASSYCVSTCLAAGLEFAFTKKLSWLLNGEYWYAKPTFKNVYQELSKSWGGNSTGGSGNVIYPVDMSTIGVNMGIALNL